MTRPLDDDATRRGYRIALRPDSDGMLDDVVVSNVSLFRMERMDNDTWWLCCYLTGSDERICWNVHREGRSVIAVTTESPPEDEYVYEHNLPDPPDVTEDRT